MFAMIGRNPREAPMLQNTFQHLPGVGEKTEMALWKQQIHHWKDLLKTRSRPHLKNRNLIQESLRESITQLQNGNARYFQERLPAGIHWRMFPEFREKAVYLDIETDGLDPACGSITTIALFDGKNVSCYIQGHNMDAFVGDIMQYNLIITYNGKCFDIPFIENYFHITIDQAQIDLRYVLAGLGLKGGLKRCESALGIGRGNLTDLDGFSAVLLWGEYRRNRSRKALETLLAYNVADTVNLEKLMIMAYNRKMQTIPLPEGNPIPQPKDLANPYQADPAIIARIKRIPSMDPSVLYRR